MSKQKAVLLMAYGTPYEIDDIMAYYTKIRHDHRPTQALYDDLVRRYQAIGGTSPLAKITMAQAEGLQARLDRAFPDTYQVFVGLKYIRPFIEETVTQIVEAGYTEIYGIPLAPHYSTFTTEGYHQRVQKLLTDPAIVYHPAKSWWQSKTLLQFWVDALQAQHQLIAQKDTKIIFSAHSLPLKMIQSGDPYQAQIEANIQAIVQQADLKPSQYTIAWQSAGRTNDEWIGPDFGTVAQQLIESADYQHILSASVGFISDNLEILYDVDIELKQIIESSGGTLTRLKMPDADPKLIEALYDVVMTLDHSK